MVDHDCYVGRLLHIDDVVRVVLRVVSHHRLRRASLRLSSLVRIKTKVHDIRTPPPPPQHDRQLLFYAR